MSNLIKILPEGDELFHAVVRTDKRTDQQLAHTNTYIYTLYIYMYFLLVYVSPADRHLQRATKLFKTLSVTTPLVVLKYTVDYHNKISAASRRLYVGVA